MAFVGMEDCFGESGKPDQLLAKYNMGTANIIAKAVPAITWATVCAPNLTLEIAIMKMVIAIKTNLLYLM